MATSRKNAAGSWKVWFSRLFTSLSIIIGIVGIVVYSIDLYRHGKDKQLIGWFSSAGFVLLTFPISIRLIVLHLMHWYNPAIQKYVVRIIWMVPLYSIESWLALRFDFFAIYIETIREVYEAYVVFNFLYYLIALLGDEADLVLLLRSKNKEKGVHFWPLNLCLPNWSMGIEFLYRNKLGVLQYVYIKNLTAIAVFLLEYFHLYGEGEFTFNHGYLYICIVNNISQMWAFYCLVLFYNATKEELAPWRPLGKFLCVKLVVFFTWWQSLVISIAVTAALGDNDEDAAWRHTEISTSLQDYLICFEMFLASIAFTFTFPYGEYKNNNILTRREALPVDDDYEDEEENLEDRKPFMHAFLQSSIPDDVFSTMDLLVSIPVDTY